MGPERDRTVSMAVPDLAAVVHADHAHERATLHKVGVDAER